MFAAWPLLRDTAINRGFNRRHPQNTVRFARFGMWRSLVAHLTGGQGVDVFGLVVLAVSLSVFAHLGLNNIMISDWTPHVTILARVRHLSFLSSHPREP